MKAETKRIAIDLMRDKLFKCQQSAFIAEKDGKETVLGILGEKMDELLLAIADMYSQEVQE